MPTTAAVILNYNGKNFLEKFLGDVIKKTSSTTEIVVIDNASTDDSLAYLTQHFPKIHCVRLGQNHGYAGGYNLGLESLNHDNFILLNSDIEVSKNWDLPLIEKLESSHKIAAVQPKILAYNNQQKFEYAGASGGYLDREYFPFCRGRIFGVLEDDLSQYEDAREVFWASGACFAVKAKIFKSFGGFDADFFAHMEEIDLCHRFKNQGHQIWVEPKSTVYHVGGGTLAMMSPYKTFLNYRNGLALLVKNAPGNGYKTKLTRRLLLDGLSAINFVLRGLPQHAFQIWKAHRAFFKNWDLWQSKREEIQKNVKYANRKGYFHGSIIGHYFLSRNRKFSQLPIERFSDV